MIRKVVKVNGSCLFLEEHPTFDSDLIVLFLASFLNLVDALLLVGLVSLRHNNLLQTDPVFVTSLREN